MSGQPTSKTMLQGAHPRSGRDSRSELELCLRDAFAAGCEASSQRSLVTAAVYAHREAPIVAERLRASHEPPEAHWLWVAGLARQIWAPTEYDEGEIRWRVRSHGGYYYGDTLQAALLDFWESEIRSRDLDGRPLEDTPPASSQPPPVDQDDDARAKEIIENLRDAMRYRRLRILGCAPGGTDYLTRGLVLRFTNLDEFVDADALAHPERDGLPTPPQAPTRCNCGAQEWPPNTIQIEDSRGRLHTLRGCQPGATSTKE